MVDGKVKAVVVSKVETSINTGLCSVILKANEPCSADFKDKTYLSNLIEAGVIKIALPPEEDDPDVIKVIR